LPGRITTRGVAIEDIEDLGRCRLPWRAAAHLISHIPRQAGTILGCLGGNQARGERGGSWISVMEAAGGPQSFI
jgi:hypothetical protein